MKTLRFFKRTALKYDKFHTNMTFYKKTYSMPNNHIYEIIGYKY